MVTWPGLQGAAGNIKPDVRTPVVLEKPSPRESAGLHTRAAVGEAEEARQPRPLNMQRQESSQDISLKAIATKYGTEFGKEAIFDAIGVAPFAKASKWIGNYVTIFGYAFWAIFLAIFIYFWVINFRNM